MTAFSENQALVILFYVFSVQALVFSILIWKLIRAVRALLNEVKAHNLVVEAVKDRPLQDRLF
jgi:hypothetical protein